MKDRWFVFIIKIIRLTFRANFNEIELSWNIQEYGCPLKKRERKEVSTSARPLALVLLQALLALALVLILQQRPLIIMLVILIEFFIVVKKLLCEFISWSLHTTMESQLTLTLKWKLIFNIKCSDNVIDIFITMLG